MITIHNQIKKDYIIKVYKDGDVINEVKLKNSSNKILIHKADFNNTIEVVQSIHKSIQELNPNLQVLTIPTTSEIEIYEILQRR
ncbi:MAG: hypothetical protein WC188_12460 [Candidatus Caldatribacteriota bacterium]